MTGRVKFFYRLKGFGYIAGDDGKDYFVSYRDIKTTEPFKYLRNESTVEFDIVKQEGRPCGQAVNVIEHLRETEIREVEHEDKKRI